jgi:predicted nucleic acid-binding protein
VFVAAIAKPTMRTGTLRLILHMLTDAEIRLIGDTYLAEEMIRYTETYPSETAISLLDAIASKTTFIEVETRYIKICRNYMGTDDLSDAYHAAACLQTGSTLISDDHHFNKIRDEGILNVWSTKTAINELLGI